MPDDSARPAPFTIAVAALRSFKNSSCTGPGLLTFVSHAIGVSTINAIPAMLENFVIVGSSEGDPHGRHERRRRRHVFEQRADARVEAGIIAGFGVLRREVFVHPL